VSSGHAFSELWFSFVFNSVRKHMHTKLLQPHSLATTNIIAAHAGIAGLHRVVSCHHWRCKLLQCLTAKYQHKRRWFSIVHTRFSILPESCGSRLDGSRNKGRECIHKTKEYSSKYPLPTFASK